MQDARLLSGTETLPAGARAEITMSIAFDSPSDRRFDNSAVATTARTAGGPPLDEDRSDDGAEPDANGNGEGDDPDEQDPTPVVIGTPLQLGAAEELLSVSQTGPEQFQVVLRIRVQNLSDVPQTNVQLTNSLTETFAAATSFEIAGAPAISGALTAGNAAYDGAANPQLLSGTETLAPGAAATVDITVNLVVSGPLATTNQTTATSAATPDGVSLATDRSDNGAVIDENGNGVANEAGENDPTPIALQPQVIGVAKAVTTVTQVNVDQFDVAFQFTVENLSASQPATFVQLNDDLAAAFAEADSFAIRAPPTVTGGLGQANTAFDGRNDTRLLSGAETLAPGARATVTVEVRITVDATTLFQNSAVVTTASSAGGPVLASDISDAGLEPDPNGNGDPDDPDEDDPTPVPLQPAVLGLAKAAGTLSRNDDGSVNVPLAFRLENFGTQIISALQLTDDLSAAFPAPASFTIEEGPTSPTLAVNTAFDGTSNPRLLTGTDTLAPGATATVALTVRLQPAGQQQFLNSALAEGLDESGDPVSDLSTNGIEPDSDGDGDPGNNGTPTPITPPGQPVLGIAKTATVAQSLGGGRFESTITITVENLGAAGLSALSLNDPLADTFGAVPFEITSAPVASGPLQGNPAYDGRGVTALLAAPGVLPAGARETVTFMVAFTPGLEAGPFQNIASGSAEDGDGNPVADTSTDGDDPDPNDDGNPDEATPTLISYLPQPQIGLAKAAGAATETATGVFELPLTFTVENLGNVELTNVTLVDDLAAIFGDAADFTVVDAPRAPAPLVANPAFNGASDTALLAPGSRLGVGERAEVTVRIEVIPVDTGATFLNTAFTRAEGPGDTPTEDSSTDGTDPDPDDNGNPEEDTPTPLVPEPRTVIGSAKRAGTVEVLGLGRYQVPFTITLENLGNTPVNGVQVSEPLAAAFPDPAGFEITSPPVLSGGLATGNAGFDGVDDVNLLSGTETLAVGATATIEFTVSFQLNGAEGPFANQVIVTGTDPDGTPSSDPSDNGDNPDPDNDGDPGGPDEDDPTDVVFPSGLFGLVFQDVDHDRTFDDGEPLLEGWIVELLAADGTTLLRTTSTGALGNYAFTDLPAGDYVVRFRHPQSGVTFVQREVTLLVNQLVEVNAPVDPQGVVYDATTRAPLPGVQLALTDNAGTRLPAACLLPGQQDQRVPDDGAYRFDLIPGAAPACPASTAQYQVAIIAVPETYRPGISREVSPEAEALDSNLCPVDPNPAEPCVVQSQNAPPALNEASTWYTSWTFGPGVPAVVNNHLPVDPLSETPIEGNALVQLIKTATVRTAVIGDLVPYEIEARNLTAFPVLSLTVDDSLPAGFQFVAGSGQLVLAGADGALRTADDVTVPLVSDGVGPVIFGPLDLAADERVLLRYLARVSTGVTRGVYRNVAVPQQGQTPVGPPSEAEVEVVGDPLFDQTTIIGTVFHDENGNGYQDQGETGIPGARVATVSGLLIETDRAGRFHIADIDVPRAERGALFILKVDPASLPDGAQVLSENPRVLRITQALMSKINFAIGFEPGTTESTVVEAQQLCTVTRTAKAAIDPVRFASGRHQIPPDFVEQLRSTLHAYRAYENVRLNFVGHTDSQRLSRTARERYGDNQGLSEQRAEAVRQFAMAALQLEESQVLAEGRGAREPIADNETADGMAQNRRVEIEVVYSETITRDAPVESLELCAGEPGDYRETVTVTAPADALPTIYFAWGDESLNPVALAEIDAVLRKYGNKDNVRLRFTGHTDNTPVRQGGAYADNLQLSRARARNAALVVSTALGRSMESFDIDGFGADQPLASNASAEGRQQNRRVELALTYDEVGASTTITKRTVEQEKVVTTSTAATRMADGTRVWATQDPLMHQPRLDVLALTPVIAGTDGRNAEPVDFAAYGNYGAFVDEYQLDIFGAADSDHTRPLWSQKIPAEALLNGIRVPAGQLATGRGQQLSYVLRGRAGEAEDVTAERLVQVLQPGATRPDRRDAREVWGSNNLARQQIAVTGSRIRIHGSDVPPGTTLSLDGQPVSVADSGRFVVERHVPDGQHRFQLRNTREDGTDGWEHEIALETEENFGFIMGLASLTIGDHSTSGDIEPLSVDDHFDESVFIDGRLAFYAKGKIKGKYLITAQLDSTEDELSNFGDNLRRKDPRRLFRQLDPDRYYPVYGDDSQTVQDVDTQGAFYVRVNWNRHEALWGNYNTGFTDSEIAQYNRTLYGAKVRFESAESTRFGDARRRLTVFGSEAQSVAAHVTFQATGGSLYYLQHTDIVEGSEKLWVEVRRRNSQQVVERRDLIEGRDYEIDAIQGRIILRQPLSQVVLTQGPAIIRQTPLDGDAVFLLADYEYVPGDFEADNVVAGARAKAWIGDHFAIGATRLTDERDGTDYDLTSVDATLRATEGTYLKVESARSEARQNEANFFSSDGGLRFREQNQDVAGEELLGRAYSVEARVDLTDLTPKDRPPPVTGFVRAWQEERDDDFSAGRLAQGVDVQDAGVEFEAHTDRITLAGGYSRLEEETLSKEAIARIQADVRLDRLTVGAELRHEDIERGARQGDALLVGARVGYELSAFNTLYGTVQTVADDSGDYQDNDLVAVGMNTRVSDGMTVNLEASDGDRGSALQGGFDFTLANGTQFAVQGGIGSGAVSQFSGSYDLAEGHELYGSYAVDPDRTDGASNVLTFGQRRQFGNHLRLFNETQFGKDDRYAGTAHVFGLDYSGVEDWVFNSSIQYSDNEDNLQPFERWAASIGASTQTDAYKFTSRLEYREDDGSGVHTIQYLTSNSLSWKLSEHARVLGQLNLSWTDDELNGDDDARFVEFDLGYAYRPADNDRWNVLAKYSYLYDLTSEGQAGNRPDQRVHVLSAEALYDLTQRVELGGKVAVKAGELRAERDSGPWFDYGARLAVLRGRYHMTKRWDALAEYRVLDDNEGNSTRHGALVGVYRHVGDHFKVGAGYNFTNFSDDLKDAEYDNHGWFVDLIGKL